MNVSIIIPVLNEEQSILKVINDIPEEFKNRIIVVDNGSTDNTLKIVSSTSAILISELQKGYGAACLKGISYLKHHLPDTEIVVFLDGDYSDYPEEIYSLLQPIEKDDFDMVIGFRKDKEYILPQAFWGNWLATKLINLFYGYKFNDLGPFRAIKFKKLLELNMQDKDFGWTVEMQIKAVLKQYKIKEVPVSYRKRIGKSKISGTFKGTICAGYKIIKTILVLRFIF